MANKPRIQTRVEEDVAGEVEAFAEEYDLNKSDATRRFVLAGMAEYDRLPDSVAPSTAGADESDTDGKPLLPAATEFRRDLGRITTVLAVATLAALLGWVLPASPLVPLSLVGALAFFTVSGALSALLIIFGQLVGLDDYAATLRRDVSRRLDGERAEP